MVNSACKLCVVCLSSCVYVWVCISICTREYLLYFIVPFYGVHFTAPYDVHMVSNKFLPLFYELFGRVSSSLLFLSFHFCQCVFPPSPVLSAFPCRNNNIIACILHPHYSWSFLKLFTLGSSSVFRATYWREIFFLSFSFHCPI